MGSNGGGFSFDLCKRNAMLERKGVTPPTAWKTGTTIAGIVFKAGLLVQSTAAHGSWSDHTS
jgi:20S proteasome subunit beta 2